MRRIVFAAVALMLCVTAASQTRMDGSRQLTFPPATVATLPTASTATNVIYVVTDSSSGCTTGGGSNLILCRSNGTTWSPVGASGGSGTVSTLSAPNDFAVANPTTTPAISHSTETVTFSATPTFNCKGVEVLTLTGNVTSSTLSGCSNQQLIIFAISQDGTGSRTLVWPTNVKGAPTITATASVTTYVAAMYDGTNAQVFAARDSAGANLVTGSGAGYYAFGQGTDQASIPNTIIEEGPTSITAYRLRKPGTNPTNNNSAAVCSNATPSSCAWAKIQQNAFVTGSAYTNASTTFSTVTGLTFPVEASTNYSGTCYLLYRGSATTAGPKFQFTGPASPTAVAISATTQITATTVAYANATTFSSSMASGTITASADFQAEIQFSVLNGANAGTLALQSAATGTGTLTIQLGSYCVIQ
jgi:hypothetical protein